MRGTRVGQSTRTTKHELGHDGDSKRHSGTSIRDNKIVDGMHTLLTKTLGGVKTEMSLHVLAYNMKRVINLIGTKQLLEAI